MADNGYAKYSGFGSGGGGGGSGTVTSVGLVDSTGLFTVTGSPVTTSGNLTLSAFTSQTQHTVLAAPSASSGAASFRLLVASDIPTLNQNTTGTASNITASSNSTLTTLSALSLPLSQTTGVATIAQGGTDNGSLAVTAGGVVYTDGTKFQNSGAGTAGKILSSNGASAPTWVDISGSIGFDFFTSSAITTASSSLSSGSFATFSNSPSFSVTPNFSGVYKVYCSIPNYLTAGGEGIMRIINTSGGATLLAESEGLNNGTSSTFNPGNSAYVQSTYTVVSGNTYVFDIQAKIVAGSSIVALGSDCPFFMFAERVG